MLAGIEERRVDSMRRRRRGSQCRMAKLHGIRKGLSRALRRCHPSRNTVWREKKNESG